MNAPEAAPPASQAPIAPFAPVGLIVCLAAALLALAFCIRNDAPWELAAWQKLTADKKLSFKESVQVGSWFASACVLAIAAMGACTSAWWSRRGTIANDVRFPQPTSLRSFVPLLLGAVLLAGVLRWNFAHNSLWWDETWNLRNAVLGEVHRAADGSLEHKPVSWTQTFFYYNKPTNHIPFSVASRTALSAWQRLTGRQQWEFDEFVFRLPNFLWSLISIVAIAWLLREWGRPGAGLLAAYLLAVHPWHVRYGIDGRGFCLMLLASLLACIALTRALRSGRWPAFLSFGASLALLLWAFPYALYLAIALGLVGVVLICTSRAPGLPNRLARYFVGLGFGAALLLPLVGPLVPQMMSWTDVAGNRMIDARFLEELWAAFATGIPFRLDGTPGGLPSLTTMSGPVLPIVFLLVPLTCLCGVTILLRRSTGPGWVLLALALAVPFAVLTAYLGTHYFYTRYVIYGMAATISSAAIATCALGRLAHDRWKKPAWIVPTVALAGFALLVWPQLAVLWTRPYSPNQQVAHFLRDEAGNGPIAALGFNLGGDMPAVYNPDLGWFENARELRDAIARSAGTPLYVFHGYDNFNRFDEPEPFVFLDDPELFKVVAEFDGIEPQFHYRVLRYTGRPLP